MKIIGFIYAASAAVLWGLVYAVDQKILVKASPLAVLFVYYLLGALLMIPFAIADWNSLRQTFQHERPTVGLIVVTSILATMANFFILASIQKTNAPFASVFEIAYPFFVIIFASLLYHAPVNTPFWLGAALMFVGAAIILRWGS